MAILLNRRRFLVLFRPGDEMKWKEDLYTPGAKFSSYGATHPFPKELENRGLKTIIRKGLLTARGATKKMANERLSPRELAFIDELEKYEDKWVAIVRRGENEKIVASGARLKDAKQQASQRGFREVVFMKVPSSHKIFIPTRLQ
jgi:Family of unknown function (DUF5678)